MKITRRTILGAGAFAAASVAFPLLVARARRAHSAPLGALVPDDAGLLDLPRGFSYKVLDRALDAMSDGYRVPHEPDGMACFDGQDGELILMRNHELDIDPTQAAYDDAPSMAYDAKVFGGVTRLVLDRRTLTRKSSNLVLAGTLRNCGGGKSPWGWLSAEESVERGHGYVFLCPERSVSLSKPERIVGYGRFNHEAVCIDPVSHLAYLTEDQPDGCLYRFRCLDPARPFEGKLQAMKLTGAPGLDTGLLPVDAAKHALEWVDIPEPDPETDSVRDQAQELGAALIRRGEGVAFHDRAVYVCATIGGRAGLGQLLRLVDGARPTLEVIAESSDSDALEMPDNISVAPWGDVYMAEDGADGSQYLRGVTPNGRVFDVARNSRSAGELAGVCFSPDHRALFANLQGDGITVAITGPFGSLSAAARS